MSMPASAFKRGLRESKAMTGVWSVSGSPVVAEALGWAGYDFVVLDMEHSPNDVPRTLSLLQALAGTPAAPVVRLPWNDMVVVKQLLDIGAQTLMFPYIQTQAEAERAVAATRYPPEGIRGVAAMTRATRFAGISDYFAKAADELCVIVQIETQDALARLADIAAVPGVDSVFVGPGDLSASLGLIGQRDHPTVTDALAKAVAGCRAAGRPGGILAADAAKAAEYRAIGYDWVAAGSDLGLMMSAARRDVAALKGAD